MAKFVITIEDSEEDGEGAINMGFLSDPPIEEGVDPSVLTDAQIIGAMMMAVGFQMTRDDDVPSEAVEYDEQKGYRAF